MSVRIRMALVAIACGLLIAAFCGVFLHWSAAPDEFDEYRARQAELARQNQELAREAAKALPHALPNDAPAAIAAHGPEGKVLPVRLTWRDAQGGGVLDEFDGCLATTPEIDVFWEGGDLFVMKQKGLLQRVWTAGRVNSPYGPMHVSELAHVCFDGKFVWASTAGFGQPTRLVVLDPQSGQTWEIGAEAAPRAAGADEASRRGGGLAMAPWQRGKVIVTGWPGHTWLTALGFDPKQGESFQPLPEPADAERKRNELLPVNDKQLIATDMWALADRAADDGREVRRLFIQRADPTRPALTALSVEPMQAQFDQAGGTSLIQAIGSRRVAMSDSAFYWLEHAPAANPRTVLAAAKAPEFAERVALTDVSDGQLAFHDGWLWSLGDVCWRWKPGEKQIEILQVEVPWKFGFRNPGESTGRNDTYYTVRRAFVSRHYGLLVTTDKQQGKVYGQQGKFFQFGLADDPRLNAVPSGEASAAGEALAADAPPGAILSVLELAAPKQQGGRPTAVLGPALEPGEVPENFALPILAREIVRQALLMAARDQLGWSTRDAVLRETSPDEKQAPAARFVLQMRFPLQAPAAFELRRLDPQGQTQPLWKEDLTIYPSAAAPCDYGSLVEAAERWSREAFPPLLEQVFPRENHENSPDQNSPAAAVPKQLEQLNFGSQFIAIKELHEAIRRQPTSPELTGELVRGYANLGVLTEYHWTAVHKALKARALLYAQQMAAANGDSPAALWHRAYAEALTGIHDAAKADLEAADKLAGALNPDGNAAQAQRPAWVELTAAFCDFDDEKLAAAEGDPPGGELAGLLHFFLVERQRYSESVQQLMERLLTENPECFRIHDARSSSWELGTLHEATLAATAALVETLPERLRQARGLPLSVRELLDRRERRQELPADIAEKLAAVGPDDDSGELSWRMFGGLIEETQFVQFWRRVKFMRDNLAVPADEYVHAAAPLIRGHRYRALLNLYLTNPLPQDAAELERQLDLSELDFEQQAEFAAGLGADWQTRRTDQYLAARQRPEQHMDDIHRDFLAYWDSFEGNAAQRPAPEVVERMRVRSPDSPDAVAAWIFRAGHRLEEAAPELEKRFARRVQVWRALALSNPFDKESQIRRLRKCIELSHDYWAYQKLAAIYHQDKRFAEWLAVLDDYLAQPSRGLEHDHVRAQIAGHYMRLNEWEKALPYALEAAQSWAAWAMVGAADCYEGLGDDENEGLWRGRLAERYPSQEDSLELYFWSRRSGVGNAPAMSRLLDPSMADWAGEPPSRKQHRVGVFYQLSGRPELALAAYQKAAQDRSELQFAYTAQLRIVLIAQELGNASLRDEALRALLSLRDPAMAPFEKTGAWIERELARGEQEPADLASARDLVASAKPEVRPALNYAIGRFLELRGRPEAANPFLDAAASSAPSRKTLSRILASAALRDRGVTPSKLKTEPIVIKMPTDERSSVELAPAGD